MFTVLIIYIYKKIHKNNFSISPKQSEIIEKPSKEFKNNDNPIIRAKTVPIIHKINDTNQSLEKINQLKPISLPVLPKLITKTELIIRPLPEIPRPHTIKIN